ncbi:YciI family protein [Nocardia gipuzkoensis]|uniref:YciI family protein n=1 Tax=Nocardia gipuzkoensis TaxID=2749991 RepID=UPI001E442606|nr:YciI family protein [Nocardia gipuzkoensis]UGT67871.1 YciI family protein [Nocardia gipuzkoensis]
MNSLPSAADHDTPDLSRLLGRDYWMVTSTPVDGTTAEDIAAVAPAHVAWLLDLEERNLVFLSGPLVSGPGVRPGAGVTVLRASDEAEASAIASEDPFVEARLRTFVVQQWRLNEGSVSMRLSLGRGTCEWH